MEYVLLALGVCALIFAFWRGIKAMRRYWWKKGYQDGGDIQKFKEPSWFSNDYLDGYLTKIGAKGQ